MIIDAHTHAGVLGEGRGLAPGELMEMLHTHGVDKAFVSTIRGFYGNCREGNDELAAYVGEYPKELYAFATVHPRDGEAAVEELRRCVDELGMIGLKLHPWLQAFSVSAPMMDPILEEAIRLHLPILFHDGTPPYCTPLQICNLADRYPEATVVLGHAGNNDLWKNALDGARRLENVIICLSGPSMHAMKTMIDALGPDRFVFGSDCGTSSDPGSLIYRLEKIRRLDIPEEWKRKILGENALILAGDKRTRRWGDREIGR